MKFYVKPCLILTVKKHSLPCSLSLEYGPRFRGCQPHRSVFGLLRSIVLAPLRQGEKIFSPKAAEKFFSLILDAAGFARTIFFAPTEHRPTEYGPREKKQAQIMQIHFSLMRILSLNFLLSGFFGNFNFFSNPFYSR